MRDFAEIESELVIPEPNTGCWLWLGGLMPGGYGHINWRPKWKYAHRLFYEQYIGPIPEDLELDHLCRMRCCVNPRHLELVTSRENTLRGNGLPAMRARLTHCPRGHEYNSENTQWGGKSNRQRNCRECAKIESRAQKQKIYSTILPPHDFVRATHCLDCLRETKKLYYQRQFREVK